MNIEQPAFYRCQERIDSAVSSHQQTLNASQLHHAGLLSDVRQLLADKDREIVAVANQLAAATQAVHYHQREIDALKTTVQDQAVGIANLTGIGHMVRSMIEVHTVSKLHLKKLTTLHAEDMVLFKELLIHIFFRKGDGKERKGFFRALLQIYPFY